MGVRKLGCDAKRLFVMAYRILPPRLPRIREPERIVRARVVRIEPHRLEIMPKRFVELARSVEEYSEIMMGFGVTRVILKCLAEMFLGSLHERRVGIRSSKPGNGNGQIVTELRIVATHERQLVLLDRVDH